MSSTTKLLSSDHNSVVSRAELATDQETFSPKSTSAIFGKSSPNILESMNINGNMH
jgi:hypothetical protein